MMLHTLSRLRFLSFLLALVVFLTAPAAPQGRQNGEIRGTVTDASQGAVPGAKVSLTNTATGVIQLATTSATGAYDFPYVTPGAYALGVEKEGFKTLLRKGIEVHVETLTVDATLEVGTVSEQVSVTSDVPLVQTESAVKSTVITSDVVSESPSISRQWYDLLATMPGVNPGGGETPGGQGIAVNGQQPYNASWQIDGGIAMLGQSANPDMLAPPIESIEEVNLNTANFGAEHGNGLSVFNVITKSGTNEFHGAAYEYIENEFFNAKNYFTVGAKPVNRWNEFGGNLGGPIKHNKAFFFVNYERNPTKTFGPSLLSFPTTAYEQGNFSSLLGGPAYTTNASGQTVPLINPCTGQQALEGQIYDPATTQTVNGQVCRDPFPGNIIPQSRFDTVAAKIQQYFPAAQNQNTLFNNYYTTLANPVTNSWTTAKVDYNFTSANRLTASFLLATFNQTFQGLPCDISCAAWAGNEPQGQITEVWTFSPTKVNEFRFSLSREHGISTVDSEGQGWPATLGMVNPVGNLFPTIWINGALNTDIGPSAGFPPAKDVETTFIPSDVFTWIKGNHIFKFGGEFDRWWVNTGWGTSDNGSYWFGGAFTQNPADQAANVVPTEGEGYADFLLGLPSAYWISISPETGGRMWSTQLFAQDAYKIRPDLTLTVGLRYVIQSGWSEVNNKISSFDPNIVNPATGTPGAMWYGGQDGRTALTKTVPDFFAPRIGVAWSPTSTWSFRAGYGLYNIIASQNTLGPASEWGQGWVPAYNGTFFTLEEGPPAGTIIYPTNANRTPDLLNGSTVWYSPYHTPLSYANEYQLDIQHQFNGGVMLDVGYVGNHGVHLQYARDINQLPVNELGQGQSARPYPQFGDIIEAFFDGWSNYNALQVSVKKQTRHGLTFAANYAYSKALDTLTSAGWGGSGAAERGGYQNSYDPAANYGPAANDLRHMFNGNFLYELPFGQGKPLANKGGFVNDLVGGWQLSSIWVVRSGLPFTAYTSDNNSGDMTLYGHNELRPNIVGDPNSGTCPNGSKVGTLNCWFNTSAFAQPTALTFGDVGRNTLRGPDWRTVDVSLLKEFPLRRLGEAGRFQFKATATDVFNRPNFGIPGRDLASAGFGVITYSNSSRAMQFGAKVSF